jgi:hypothetical protein
MVAVAVEALSDDALWILGALQHCLRGWLLLSEITSDVASVKHMGN